MAKKSQSKAVGGALISVIAKVPVHHDGDLYQPGETLELTEAELRPLLNVQAVELAPVDTAAE